MVRLEQMVAMYVAGGVFDGIPFCTLVGDVQEIDWQGKELDEVQRVLSLAGALLDAGFAMTTGPFVFPIDLPWQETSRDDVLVRIEREFRALAEPANLMDIGWFELPRGSATVDEELAKMLGLASVADISCIPIFAAAARMTPWGQTVDRARRQLMAAMLEAGFVATEPPRPPHPGRPWLCQAAQAVLGRFEQEFQQSVDGRTLLDLCWFRHPQSSGLRAVIAGD